MSNRLAQFGSALWREVKAAGAPLTFPGFGGGQNTGFSSLFGLNQLINGAYANSRQNWAALIGDPSTSSLVITAAGWVGRRLPEATLRVVEVDSEDNEKPIANHPLLALIARPNPYYDAAMLWEHFAFSWILDGNVYWLIRRNSRGQAVEIWPLFHWLTTPRWNSESNWIDYYEYSPNGRSIYYSPQDIIHFRVGVSDPENTRKGMSPLRSVLREVFSDSEIASYSALLIKNSGVPPLIVTTKEMAAGLSDDEIKGFAADLQRRVSGDQRGKLMFHTWPLEVQKLSFDPEEMDLRKLRFMSEERFAAVIGINPIVLNFGVGAEHNTYANVESARRSAVQEYLCPLWVRNAGTLEHQLLPLFGAADNQHVRFDTSTVTALQEQENDKHQRVRDDMLAGLIKVKDAQMLLGWTPDAQADYYLRPSGFIEVRDGWINGVDPNAEPAIVGEAMPEGEEDEEQKKLPPAEKSILYLPEGRFKALHAFSSTQFDIVGASAAAMLRFREAIPDEDLAEGGREGNAHITALYGIHTESADDVRMALGRAFSVKVAYGRTDYFAVDGYDVVYVSVESGDLMALNRLLRAGLEHTATQDEYIPHATLAYVKSGLGARYAGSEVLKDMVDSFSTLTFSSKNGLRTQLPLAMVAMAAD